MQKSPDAFRTISDVADWLETPAHVLRFWESRFKEVDPVKRAGGRRYYRFEDMQLLGGIKQLLHEDGLTIRGVQKVLRENGIEHVKSLCPRSFDTPSEVSEISENPVKPIDPAVAATSLKKEQAVSAPISEPSAPLEPAVEKVDDAADWGDEDWGDDDWGDEPVEPPQKEDISESNIQDVKQDPALNISETKQQPAGVTETSDWGDDDWGDESAVDQKDEDIKEASPQASFDFVEMASPSVEEKRQPPTQSFRSARVKTNQLISIEAENKTNPVAIDDSSNKRNFDLSAVAEQELLKKTITCPELPDDPVLEISSDISPVYQASSLNALSSEQIEEMIKHAKSVLDHYST